MDVCSPKVIEMRIHKGKTIEGERLAYYQLNTKTNTEIFPEQMMTFPFMANSESCNGCMECVKECPTYAIEILFDNYAAI